MILHLLKFDWQRIKRTLVVLWFLLFLAAAPWLLHRPGDWQLPQWSGMGWNSRLGEMPANFMSRPWSDMLIVPAEILGTILALILASMLGAQWVKQPGTPIRRRDRLIALGLSLLVFIVLPQWILAFANLLLHGFSPGIAALAAGATALSAWLLLGLFAALAAWLPSVWLLLAGLAALATSVGFISEFYRPWKSMFRGNPTLQLLPVGPREWLFCALAIFLLAILFPACRTRLNGPWKIVVAVALILIATVPAWWLPDPEVPIVKAKAIATAAIKPSIGWVQIQTNFSDQLDQPNRIELSGSISSTGCPPGYAVNWTLAAGGWISQDGKRVATSETADADQTFNTQLRYPDMEKAVVAALPNGRITSESINPNARYSHNLGSFEILPSAVISPDRDAELHTRLTGTVFRFETVWDIPPGERIRKIQAGNLQWRFRQYPTDNGEPRAEIMVTHPALGISSDADEIRWDDSRIFNSLLYFHLPATGTNIRASDSLMSSSGPLFSAAGWDRAIIAPSNLNLGKFDLTGLRLILLKPVAVARFTTTAVTRFRPWTSGEASDFALDHRYPVNEATYRREYFPKRPDPRTCSREEFARWLRIPASMFPVDAGPEYDLAAYAPRFAGMMAKVGNHWSVAEGLRLGTPESLRHEVIGQIEALERPDHLAEVALARGWLGEARESILRRFREGNLEHSAALLALEEPATYPELISRFLGDPQRETYEQLRLLPGIEPLLTYAIDGAARETAPVLRPTTTAPYGPFLYAAKQGDTKALETVLKLFKVEAWPQHTSFRDLDYILALPDLPGHRVPALTVWLRGKSAASFRFDPLLRLWKPLP